MYVGMLIRSDERELDIPNGENNAENEEEQDQPEVEEQEFYVEGWFFPSSPVYFLIQLSLYFYCMLHSIFVINIAWKLVEENVYAKPMDGPSNGQREDKDEKKPDEDEAASSSEGTVAMLYYYFMLMCRVTSFRMMTLSMFKYVNILKKILSAF